MNNPWFAENGSELSAGADVFLDELERDVMAADFTISLMVAAANSYRFHTALRPYPPFNQKEEGDVSEEAHDRLKRLLEKVPPLQSIMADDELRREDVINFLGTSELIDILSWTMVPDSFKLNALSVKKAFPKMKELTGQKGATGAPTHVFEVCWTPEEEERWELRKNSAKTMFAYHGSRLENFHSILRLGLHQHLNKNSLYGKGTYLSSELSVCFAFSPNGFGWAKSMLGDTLSCVAVCEIIPGDGVRCGTKTASGLPEKYFVVANNDKMRVKYILVYASYGSSFPRKGSSRLLDSVGAGRRESRTRSEESEDGRRERGMSRWGSVTSWLSKNCFTLLILIYVATLVAVGLSNSKFFTAAMKRFFKLQQ